MNEALASSIFFIIGLMNNSSIDDMASLYRVPGGQFELWLKQLGFPIKEIDSLRKRTAEPGKCLHCGILTENEFCSTECLESYKSRQILLELIRQTGLIPVCNLKNVYYNTKTKKVKRTHDYS